MELEIKIADIEEAVESEYKTGRPEFKDWREEIEWLNEKYKDEFERDCRRAEKKKKKSEDYLEDYQWTWWKQLKIDMKKFWRLVKNVITGEIVENEPEKFEKWIVPYDPDTDTIWIGYHIPIDEWKRFKKKWKNK